MARVPHDEPVIRVRNLSKCYQIYEKPSDRLRQFVLPRIRRIFKLSDKRYYKEFWALKDVSFDVFRGETVGIIGRNGAGKSTLLQMLCGTLHPSEGTVEVSGRVAALLELGSGFNPEFSGRENVYLNAAVWGLSRQEVESRYASIVEFSEIGDFVEQPVKTYSSGMMMRLAFAVIAHVDADVLIVDEALSVGDAYFTQKCMRFLRRFMERGTVLFVSHDTGAVVNLCDSAIWLAAGKVRSKGAPKELSNQYLADMYMEQSSLSELAGEHGAEMPRDYDLNNRYDQRREFLNSSNLRNDIEVFDFNFESESFGVRGATIVNVQLLDADTNLLSWCVGGEDVVLRIVCIASREIFNPIVGFNLKDKLGQSLFGDNTFLTYLSSPLHVSGGETFCAEFSFVMPVLPVGDYTLDVAVAEGTQDEHTQHHWIYDALHFKSHASSAIRGLVGIPMRSIVISKQGGSHGRV